MNPIDDHRVERCRFSADGQSARACDRVRTAARIGKGRVFIGRRADRPDSRRVARGDVDQSRACPPGRAGHVARPLDVDRSLKSQPRAAEVHIPGGMDHRAGARAGGRERFGPQDVARKISTSRPAKGRGVRDPALGRVRPGRDRATGGPRCCRPGRGARHKRGDEVMRSPMQRRSFREQEAEAADGAPPAQPAAHYRRQRPQPTGYSSSSQSRPRPLSGSR